MLTSFLKSPRTIGSVIPSSVALGQALSEKINPTSSLGVIELGAGAGQVTAQILKRLPSPDLLTCVEIDRYMCARFRASLPGVNLLERDCREIGSIFSGHEFANIISCLPYKSLPRSTTDTIFEQKISLSNSRTIISMFSYDFIFANYHRRYGIRLLDSRPVFLNFPPARVYHYTL